MCSGRLIVLLVGAGALELVDDWVNEGECEGRLIRGQPSLLAIGHDECNIRDEAQGEPKPYVHHRVERQRRLDCQCTRHNRGAWPSGVHVWFCDGWVSEVLHK